MGDFHQNGVITTLHNLGQRPLKNMEDELESFKPSRPMGLVLPSLFSELEGPALSGIIDELVGVPYLDEIVIGLDRANQEQYEYALDYFSRLPQHLEMPLVVNHAGNKTGNFAGTNIQRSNNGTFGFGLMSHSDERSRKKIWELLLYGPTTLNASAPTLNS